MSIKSYYPEMGEKRPANVQGNVTLARSRGCHYFIETPLMLKGQGIKHVEVLKASNLTERGQYKAGWNVFWVTRRAMDKLEQRYDFAREALLD